MFIFETRFAEKLKNRTRRGTLVRIVLEIIPNGVVLRWSGMVTNDFRNDSFPAIRSAVNSDNRWGELETGATWGSFMRFESNLSFKTTFSANNSTIVRLDKKCVVTRTGHI